MNNSEHEGQDVSLMDRSIGRRSLIKYAGFTAAASALIITGCKKDEPEVPQAYTGIDLGSGDIGILNYAYALEQLEAAFYTAVMQNPYSGMTADEAQILGDVMQHELAHRDFFKAAIGSAAIPGLEVNFSSIDFSSRASVLGTAKAFEDLGVSAYNGAGQLLVTEAYLLIAGKIVSVEARHAAAIRDLLNPGSSDFSGDDIINAQGLDLARTPAQVLAIASAYLKSTLNPRNLPTS